MTEHCHYIVIPDDDRPPVVVETHPFPAQVSDDLGGAHACCPIILPVAKVAVFVREDAATTGYGRNFVASILATLMNDWRKPVLILGPAVFNTMTHVGFNPTTGNPVSTPEGFRPATAAGLVTVAADVQAALSGSDGPFQTQGLVEGWSVRVRAFRDRLAALPIAEDWPESENRPRPVDHVSAALEAHYPGRQFVLYEPGPTH